MARLRTPPRPGARVLPSAPGGAGGGVRVVAAWVLERTLSARAPVDTFLEGAQAPLDERDQGLLRELVLGSLRWLRRLDGVISAAGNRPLDEIDRRLLPLLRIATYQLLFLDRVPAHAAVNEAVEQASHATHRGGASFVNAVLRRIARAPHLSSWPVAERDPVRRLAAERSHPDFLVARWVERFGLARTAELLDANNRPKPVQLLAFRDCGGRESLAEALIDEGVDVEPSALSPLALSVRSGNPFATAAFARGAFYIQDEASQAAALVPPPRAGERILDAAAAPGGKTFAMQAYEPAARIVSADLALARSLVLRQNAARLRRRAALAVSDAAAPAFRDGFDRVVLDLPCTGTGTLRKNPELKWRISESEIGRLSSQALRMLQGCAPLVGVGGLLVAVTCSLEEEENERVVERFLAAAPAFAPLDLGARLGASAERFVGGPGMWRLFPGGDHDGFTVHVLRRLY
jgi:16S rRNA (cytosine967-C5)-methyltransferase